MRWITKHSGKILGLSVVINILFWALVAAALVVGIRAIDEHGLKSVVERIWEGPQDEAN